MKLESLLYWLKYRNLKVLLYVYMKCLVRQAALRLAIFKIC